jgi:GNAT superfamily N-acetyltransferase
VFFLEHILLANLSDSHHANTMVRLLDAYACDAMGGGEGLSDYTKTHLANALAQRAGVHVLLAFVNEAPAGLAICMEGFSTFACKPLLNIHDVYVAPAFRGTGLSSRLLSKAESIARGLGCCKLTLEVLEGNKVAQASYVRFGFAGYQLDPATGRAMFWQKKLS